MNEIGRFMHHEHQAQALEVADMNPELPRMSKHMCGHWPCCDRAHVAGALYEDEYFVHGQVGCLRPGLKAVVALFLRMRHETSADRERISMASCVVTR
eukprot:5826106-Amphidinium_carterae.1